MYKISKHVLCFYWDRLTDFISEYFVINPDTNINILMPGVFQIPSPPLNL